MYGRRGGQCFELSSFWGAKEFVPFSDSPVLPLSGVEPQGEAEVFKLCTCGFIVVAMALLMCHDTADI